MPNIHENQGFRKPRKSAFDLSHEKKLSFNMGELVPILLEEIVPGDEFKVETETLMRLAPMLAPVMHRVNVYCHYFFVPNRITWNQWEDFITGGREGTTSPNFPTVEYGDLWEEYGNSMTGSLADYLGIPSPSGAMNSGGKEISKLPFMAYNQIYNDFYRDPNLQEEIVVNDSYGMQKRCWEKDYFTSCLPWPQRGPQVDIPVNTVFEPQYADKSILLTESGASLPSNAALTSYDPGAPQLGSDIKNGGATADSLRVENLEPSFELDGTSVTINELRQSNKLQQWLEKQARGGYRYIETILSHFGVKSSDARLQRAEYLGGGRQPIVISEVLNTTGTTEAAQGTMAGHGISVGTTNKFKKRFEEHGYVMGIMSVLPRTGYQQGIARHWQRTDKTEYYWPEFATLGEQEVKDSELYFNATDPQPTEEGTFGYQQRYAEYKYGVSSVHGRFRDNLDYWHMGRKFDSAPALNTAFVNADPTDRIFAVTDPDEHHLWVQVYNKVLARRPMPFFSNPSL
ncbi:major capsid protein [Microviridae sp.]|nr:major capsid protein [Microviridae sp.]